MSDSDELARLADLHQRGALSDEEFARAKARVLSGVGTARSAPSGAPVAVAINGLRRSRYDRWLGGVCGGIADITGLASWIWRVLFVMLVLCAGGGLLLYLLLWLFVPEGDLQITDQRPLNAR